MCGIWLCLTKKGRKMHENRYETFRKIQHRGPDRSHFLELQNYGLSIGFHRLSIMDTSVNGDQPFVMQKGDVTIYVICNGEIYNFQRLCHKYELELKSGSDCEVLIHLYEKIGLEKMCEELEGEYGFCICEIHETEKTVKLMVGRDPVGVRPLFYGISDDEIVIS